MTNRKIRILKDKEAAEKAAYDEQLKKRKGAFEDRKNKAKQCLKAIRYYVEEAGATVRPLDEWVPTGKSSQTVFRSLVKHAFFLYDVPDFFYSCFPIDHQNDPGDGLWRLVLYEIGKGTSAFTVLKQVLATAIKRRVHKWLQVRGDHHPLHAWRAVQVEEFGGSERVYQQACSLLGNGLRENDQFNAEAFHEELIRWLSQHPMIPVQLFGPIIDYAKAMKQEIPTYSMKGRSPVKIVKAVNEWHDELATQKVGAAGFTKSGFSPMEWVVREDEEEVFWNIEEILSAKELAKEGKTLRHCVITYGKYIVSGEVSIWGLRRNGKRVLTVEVRNKRREIAQARGLKNRPTEQKELKFLNKWAIPNEIKLRSWL